MFFLSPVALLVVLGIQLYKRFTPLCHLMLGTGIIIGANWRLSCGDSSFFAVACSVLPVCDLLGQRV